MLLAGQAFKAMFVHQVPASDCHEVLHAGSGKPLHMLAVQ
jgi:hypothetical protein